MEKEEKIFVEVILSRTELDLKIRKLIKETCEKIMF